MKYLLVINPVSGGVDKKDFLSKAKQLLDRNGHEYEIFRTRGKNDRDNLKNKVSETKPDRLIAIGGDGTILLVSLAIMDSDIPMGIIPMGSANGMSAELKINQNPLTALKEILMSVKLKDLDLIRVNDEHYSIHIGDIGTNAEIVYKFEQNESRGLASYAKFFLEELRNSKPFKIEIKTKDRVIKENVVMLAICNGRTYGTGIPINVQGEPGDGKFELVLIKEVNLNALIKAGLSKIDERFFGDEAIEVISATEAKIKLDNKKNLQLDGEVIGKVNQMKIEIIPSAIKLVISK